MLIENTGPSYRHPPVCSRHPMYSEPCPWCREEEALDEKLLQEIMKHVEEKLKTNETIEIEDLHIRNIGTDGTRAST